jgi:hypothetical protein
MSILPRIVRFRLPRTHVARPRKSSSAIRLDTFLAVGILLLSTTRVEEVAYALGRVGMPYKAGFTLTLAFRLVPVFFDAALAVVEAQRCRGLEVSRGGLVAVSAAASRSSFRSWSARSGAPIAWRWRSSCAASTRDGRARRICARRVGGRRRGGAADGDGRRVPDAVGHWRGEARALA